MSAGASTAAPKVRAPALVVIPKSPTTALPPSSLTTTLRMTRADGLVVVGDRAGDRRVARGEGDAARVERAAAAVGAGPVGRRVAGQRELGEGVGAGRDLQGRGGVGEGVGRGLDGGAEGQGAGAGGDPEVAHDRAAAVVVDDDLADDEADGLVVVGDRAGDRRVARGEGDAARVERAAAAVGAGPVARRVAGQRELGEGVGAGRDLQGRGGVGEGVGGGLDGGAEGQGAGAGGDAEVAHDRAAAVVVDDDLAMTSWICLVFVNVQVEVVPGIDGHARRWCHRRRSRRRRRGKHAAAGPMVTGAVRSMSVSVQPAGTASPSTVLGAELRGPEGEWGCPLGARATVVARLKVAGTPVPVPVKSKVAVTAHGLFSIVERGILGVRERAGRGVPARDHRAHGGVARIEAGGGALGEGAADAGADGDHGAVGGAHDVRERPAGLGRLLDVLGPELEAVNVNGALVVGLATAVSRVKGARPEPLTA